MSIRGGGYRTGGAASTRELGEDEEIVDADGRALRLELRDRARAALVIPIEEPLHLLRADPASELDQPTQYGRARIRRPQALRGADRLGVAAHEEVVRVVVVVAALADGLHARDVHEALQLLDRALEVAASLLRLDAEIGAHALLLRLAAVREVFDDAARQVGESSGANVVEVVIGLAGAAERRVERREHLHRDERRLLHQQLAVVELLRLGQLVLPRPHPVPLLVLAVRREVIERGGDGVRGLAAEGEAEAERVDERDKLRAVPHAVLVRKLRAVCLEAIAEIRRARPTEERLHERNIATRPATIAICIARVERRWSASNSRRTGADCGVSSQSRICDLSDRATGFAQPLE